MRAKNGSSHTDETQKLYLRPYFGDLLIVLWSSTMPNWWMIIYAGFKVDIGQEHSLFKPIANVFMLMTHKPVIMVITLLAHEFIHLGSVSNLMVQLKFDKPLF